MKPTLYTLLAAAVACGLASAAETAYTTPVGYNTQNLAQGFNTVGLTLQTPTLAAGSLDTVSGVTLTDNEASVSTVAGRTYVLEVTTGTLTGAVQELADTDISGGTFTTPEDLEAQGLVAGDEYAIRVAPTLEEIFGTTSVTSGGVLQAGLNSNGADVVWIPNGSGGYNQYFLHTTGAFRIAGTTTASPNVPVIYPDGLLVQKKGTTAAALTVTGEVKLVGTNSIVIQGFNLLSVVSPVGLTLANAGFEDDIQAGLNANGADIVWVQQSNLSYIKYFRHTTGNWRNVATPTVNMTPAEVEAVVLPTAVYIQRKNSAAIALDLNVPSDYSTL